MCNDFNFSFSKYEHCILWLQVGGHTPLVEAISLVGPNPVLIIQSLLKHGANPNLSRGDVPSPTTSESVSPDDLDISQWSSLSFNEPTSDTEVSPRGHSNRCSPSLPRPLSKHNIRKEAESEVDDCSLVVSKDSSINVQKGETRSQNENGTIVGKGLELLAGVNQGESCYTPLHVACAHRSNSDEQHKLVRYKCALHHCEVEFALHVHVHVFACQ